MMKKMSIFNFKVEFYRGEFDIPLLKGLKVISDSSSSMMWWKGSSVPFIRSTRPIIYLYPDYDNRPFSFIKIELESILNEDNDVYWDCAHDIFLRLKFDRESNTLTANYTIEMCGGNFYSGSSSVRVVEGYTEVLIEPSYSPYNIVLKISS